MKEYLCTQYQGLVYEEGFGPDEVPHSQQNKRCVDTRAIISIAGCTERQKIFGEDEGLRYFLKCNLCITNNMDQLHKALAFTKYQGLMTGLYGQLQVNLTITATSASGVLAPAIVVALTIVLTIISGLTPEMKWLTTIVVDFSISDPSLSPSHITKNYGASPSTPIE